MISIFEPINKNDCHWYEFCLADCDLAHSLAFLPYETEISILWNSFIKKVHDEEGRMYRSLSYSSADSARSILFFILVFLPFRHTHIHPEHYCSTYSLQYCTFSPHLLFHSDRLLSIPSAHVYAHVLALFVRTEPISYSEYRCSYLVSIWLRKFLHTIQEILI